MQDSPVLIRKAGADISPQEEEILQKGLELRTYDRIVDMGKLYDALFHTESNQDTPKIKKAHHKGHRLRLCPIKVSFFLRKYWYLFLPAFFLFLGIAAAFYLYQNTLTGNKVMAVPLHLQDITDDKALYDDAGTWTSLNCGTVSAFSDSYAFSCSLYFPKHVFKAEPSKIKIEYWLDMVHDDICFGTTDSTYYLNLIHEGDETFCVAYDAQTGNLCPPRERAVPYECSDEGNYYKLKIENLPYLPLMHKEDSSALTAIDTERGGDVVVNMKISGIGQNLSSFVYLDDIVLKDNGKTIVSFDCSVESLYGYNYFYRYESSDGERQEEGLPEITTIYNSLLRQ